MRRMLATSRSASPQRGFTKSILHRERPRGRIEADRDAAVSIASPRDDRALDHAGLLPHERERRACIDNARLHLGTELPPGGPFAVQQLFPADGFRPCIE